MNTYTSKRHSLIFKVAFILILITGLSLRFYQHFMGRSLWEDEAHIALNFINSGYQGLTKPLENFQTAPIFFLFSVEIFSEIFGWSEIALRSFPFVVSILTFPLFYFFVLELTKNRIIALLAFLLMALNLSFIYYGSETKSYIIDVSAYTIIGYLAVSSNRFIAQNRGKLLAVVGCIVPFYTNASIIILFCAAIYLVSQWRREKSLVAKNAMLVHVQKADLINFILWPLAFAINYFKFLHDHPYAPLMKEIWSSSFCPTNVFGEEFKNFIDTRIADTFFVITESKYLDTSLLYFTRDYFFPYILIIIAAASIVYAFVSGKRQILIFSILPIVLHLILSMFKMYPFFYRFILYLIPAVIILLATGVAAIARILQQKIHMALAAVFVAYFCFCACKISLEKFPDWQREVKPVLNIINEKYPDKKIFVPMGQHTLLQYYSRINYLKNPNFQSMPEWRISLNRYYEIVANEQSDYILVYSANGFDEYVEILKDLKDKGLIISQFEYKTYGLVQVKPNKS